MSKVFLKSNHPLLRKTAEKIPIKQINSPQTKKVIQRMLTIARGKQGNSKKPIMVGLAAPQIGISKRIILVDVKADGKGKVGKLKVFINPEIIWISKKQNEWYEGCYSLSGICGIVSRPLSIKVRGFRMQPSRLQAKLSEEKYTGYAARIFQHEIDHLNGKFFTQHIKDPKNLHSVKPSEFSLYRNKKAWKNWPKIASLPLDTIMPQH